MNVGVQDKNWPKYGRTIAPLYTLFFHKDIFALFSEIYIFLLKISILKFIFC